MGFLDDVLNKAVPQGSGIAKPLMLAFVALLASGALTRKQAPGASPGSGAEAGGLLGGLGGLLGTLQQSGLGDVAKSWVGSGQNQPISPGSLGSALGPSIVKALAEKTGMSEQEVTAQLSQVLPGLVDKLTPQGRLPTQDELSRLGG
ncbi:MAG: YidB family protein [Beijerinckiaceae bacterium]